MTSKVKVDLTWNRQCASDNGHPLQSMVWGEALERAEGRVSEYISGGIGKNRWLARVEERTHRVLGKVAWVARGPVTSNKESLPIILDEISRCLKKKGFSLIIFRPWLKDSDMTWAKLKAAGIMKYRGRDDTIWIDLESGLDIAWGRLEKGWRYGVRKARRQGVEISWKTDNDSIENFFRMCTHVSYQKGFSLPGSLGLVQEIFKDDKESGICSRLVTASVDGEMAAGAIVMGSGERLHYMWGFTDKSKSFLRAGELVQWEIIEWAVQEGYKVYDLEGIDKKNNLGTYRFKKKMGGEEVVLCGAVAKPLTKRAWVAVVARNLKEGIKGMYS